MIRSLNGYTVYKNSVRRETGKIKGESPRPLKDQQSQGPESCVAYREVWGEALTGVLTGQPLSHEMYIKLPGADVVLFTEGNIIGCDTASATWTRRGLRPGMSIRSLRGEISSDHLPVSEMARTGKTRR